MISLKLLIINIDDVLMRFSDMTASEISEWSYGDIPWQVHKQGEIIDYHIPGVEDLSTPGVVSDWRTLVDSLYREFRRR